MCVKKKQKILTACALMLQSGVYSLVTVGHLQVTEARVGHIISAADGIGSQITIRRTLTLGLAVGHDARPAISAVSFLTGL